MAHAETDAAVVRRERQKAGHARSRRGRTRPMSGCQSYGRRLGSMDVKAPVAGEVFGMTVSAPGEVVRPGGTDPENRAGRHGVVARAQLEPIHVDQVRPGRDAVLRFSASRRAPRRSLPGVSCGSRRTRRDERTGLSWCEVELAMGDAVEVDLPSTEPATKTHEELPELEGFNLFGTGKVLRQQIS